MADASIVSPIRASFTNQIYPSTRPIPAPSSPMSSMVTVNLSFFLISIICSFYNKYSCCTFLSLSPLCPFTSLTQTNSVYPVLRIYRIHKVQNRPKNKTQCSVFLKYTRITPAFATPIT